MMSAIDQVPEHVGSGRGVAVGRDLPETDVIEDDKLVTGPAAQAGLVGAVGEAGVELGELHEALGRLRLCDAAALQAMERSLVTVGQISPLVVHEAAHGLEVLDGFKRLRAARALKWSCLFVQVVRVGAVQAKLQLCQSNRAGGLTEIEEAWVVRALYREDGLTQPEIGRLMGRNKSWVNRRLQLAEALSDELQVDLRIGLVSATTARELCRLPRDNQQEVATTVKQRGLTTRQMCGENS